MNTVIHAAVRRDLRRFEAALADFPAGSGRRARQLSTAWQNLDHQLDHHHSSEETIFWPALQSSEALDSLLHDLEGEHHTMLTALSETRATMAALAGDPSAERATEASAAMARLREVVEAHFAHEEAELEPVMAAAHGSPQMTAAQQAVRRTQTLPQAGVYLAWLQDGASAEEKAFLARLLPPPVLAFFTRVLGLRYARRIAPVWT